MWQGKGSLDPSDCHLLPSSDPQAKLSPTDWIKGKGSYLIPLNIWLNNSPEVTSGFNTQAGCLIHFQDEQFFPHSSLGKSPTHSQILGRRYQKLITLPVALK